MIPETGEEHAARPRGWPSRVLLILVAAAAVVVFVLSTLDGHHEKDASDTGDEIDIPAVDDPVAVPASGSALPSIAWADDTGVAASFEGSNPTHIEAEAGCCVAWAADAAYLAYQQGDTISIRHRE